MNIHVHLLRIAVCCAALIAAATASAQSVTISFGAGLLYDFNGSLLGSDRLVLLVADTSGGDFGSLVAGSTLRAGDFLNSSTQILGRAVTDADSEVFGSFEIPLSNNPVPGPYTWLTPGDKIALVWFSSLTGSSTSLSSGERYGLFSGITPNDGASWIIPSSGSNIDINFRTLASGGTHAETEAYSNMTAIPEPSTYAAIFGAGALCFAICRRKRR